MNRVKKAVASNVCLPTKNEFVIVALRLNQDMTHPGKKVFKGQWEDCKATKKQEAESVFRDTVCYDEEMALLSLVQELEAPDTCKHFLKWQQKDSFNNKYLLNTHCVPGIVLGTGEYVMKEKKLRQKLLPFWSPRSCQEVVG